MGGTRLEEVAAVVKGEDAAAAVAHAALAETEAVAAEGGVEGERAEEGPRHTQPEMTWTHCASQALISSA